MELKHLYGPIPSRRLGYSLGISPIPKKTCNYSCVYCQLGRTNPLTNKREMFYPVSDIIKEFDEVISENLKYDVVSIVGEGEPTLYLGLGEVINEIKKRTTKPVAVITNGALLIDQTVREELGNADIVLPSLNAYDEESFKKINRAYPKITYKDTIEGLIKFCNDFKGEIWLEIMLLSGFNDDDYSLNKFKELIKEIRYNRLYLNTPVRPPAEAYVQVVSDERMKKAVEVLGGISIELLSTKEYQSGVKDDYQAIISIIKRHPMNQHEIEGLLKLRGLKEFDTIFNKLKTDESIEMIDYKGYNIYRLK